MSWLSRRTLRGWFIMIVLGALLAGQAASLGLLWAQEDLLRSALHEAEAFRRTQGLVALARPADAATRKTIQTTASGPYFHVSFDEKPYIAAGKGDPELARALGAITGLPADAIHVSWAGKAGQNFAVHFVQRKEIKRSQTVTAAAPHDVRIVVDAQTTAIMRAPAPPAPPAPPPPPAPPSPLAGDTSFVWAIKSTGAPEPNENTSTAPEPLVISVKLDSKTWLNVLAAPPETQSALMPLLAAGGIAAVLVALAALWAAGKVSEPLSGLAAAANQFGRGESLMLAPVQGPRDVAQAAEAFNSMAHRLKRTLEDQRALLAAVGHDLRTPLATLRVRAEQIHDRDLQDRILATLAEMERLTVATLNAARGGETGEREALIDMPSLVQAVCDDLADAGMPVQCGELSHARVQGRAGELRRALQNLIENAVRYGGLADVTLAIEGPWAVISVEDGGPGIPEPAMAEVIKPFVRLEASRNQDTGGHGLGLPITRAIVERHGGRLDLQNRAQGGLRAALVLPVAGA